jgi:hypothetical protein
MFGGGVRLMVEFCVVGGGCWGVGICMGLLVWCGGGCCVGVGGGFGCRLGCVVGGLGLLGGLWWGGILGCGGWGCVGFGVEVGG